MPLWIKTCVNKQLTGLVRSIFTVLFSSFTRPYSGLVCAWIIMYDSVYRSCVSPYHFSLPHTTNCSLWIFTLPRDEYVTLYTVCTTYVNCAHARAVYTKHKHKHIWTLTIKLNLHNGLTGYGCFELEFFRCNRSIVGYSATFSQPLFVFKQNLC